MISNATPTDFPEVDPAEIDFQRLKTSVHEELVESLDLAAVGEIDNEQMREEVRELSGDIVKRRRLNLPKETRSRLLEELQHEVFGLGPLEGLIDDPTISDILVNGPGEVYIERLGSFDIVSVLSLKARLSASAA